MKIYYTAVPTNSKEFLSRILRDFYGISTPKITKNSYGKPYFIDFSLFFSISHSENITAIALSKREIGLDIQKNAKKRRNESLKDFLSPKNRRIFTASGRQRKPILSIAENQLQSYIRVSNIKTARYTNRIRPLPPFFYMLKLRVVPSASVRRNKPPQNS